jgi:hypothetical protein
LSISKRNYDEDDSKFLFDLTLLFKVDKKNSAKLVCDLENRFMELYDYETKNVKILLNEVYVKLEKNKNS